MKGKTTSNVDKRVTKSAATGTGLGQIELRFRVEDFSIEANETVHVVCEQREMVRTNGYRHTEPPCL
jgi:hypothetical protein